MPIPDKVLREQRARDAKEKEAAEAKLREKQEKVNQKRRVTEETPPAPKRPPPKVTEPQGQEHWNNYLEFLRLLKKKRD